MIFFGVMSVGFLYGAYHELYKNANREGCRLCILLSNLYLIAAVVWHDLF